MRRRTRMLAARVVAGAVLAGSLGAAAFPAHAATTARVQAGTLKVTGDAASEALALRLQAGYPTTLEIDVGDDGTADFSFDRSTFTAVDVAAGGGDDQLRIDQLGGAFIDEAVTLNGGAGDDVLTGGAGADTLIGGGGNDVADGNTGTDLALLGAGDDRFRWDPGDASDVVEGQGGADALAFNASNAGESVALAGSGTRARLTRDIGAVTLELDAVERVGLTLLAGADTVTVGDLARTGVAAVDVDLDALGGGGDQAVDTVVATGTDVVDAVDLRNADGRIVVGGLAAQTRVLGGEGGTDSLVVSLLGGADTAAARVGVTSPIQVHVDGGEGVDAARYDGTPVDDVIGIVRNGVDAAVFELSSVILNVNPTVERLVVAGLQGNDSLAAQNGLAAVTQLTLDGGDGDDAVRGGDGADTLLGGTGNDLVDGNIGADRALLGSGDDRFQWDPGDASDVVDGEGGADALDFNASNASETIALSGNGVRTLLTRDVGAVTMDVGGVERAQVRLLGGVDTIDVGDLAGTGLATVDVDLDASVGGGDAAADRVIARGTEGADAVGLTNAAGRIVVGGLAAQTRVLGGEGGTDSLVVSLLGGADTAAARVGVTSPIQVHVDGGEGVDAARYDGTPVDDVIGIVRNGVDAAVFELSSVILNVNPTVERLVVAGLQGNDSLAAQNGLAAVTQLTLDGGDGDDAVRGGDGADTLLGGTGNDLVDGNIGADHVLMGAGDDRFQWDPGDGSDVVDGQGGADALDFNASNAGENVVLSANGSRIRLTRDIGAVTMDLASAERIAVRALGGADTIVVGDLAGTTVAGVDVDLSATIGGADGAVDMMVVNGTNARDVVQATLVGGQATVSGLRAQTRIVGSEAALDTLLVQTHGGNDDVTVAPDLAAVIATTVDLGSDE